MNAESRSSTRFFGRRRWGLLAAFLFAAAYLVLNLFVRPAIPMARGYDDQIFLASAARLSSGQVIYRDFFEYYLPGIDYLYAFLIDRFGARAWIPNACLVVLGLGLFAAAVWLGGMLMSREAAIFSGFLFLFAAYRTYLDASPHWYAALTIVLAIAILARERSRSRLLVAGALIGVATCFAQHHGAFATVGVLGFLVWEAWKDGRDTTTLIKECASFLTPTAIIVAACVAYFSWLAGPTAFFNSTIVFPLKYWSEGLGAGWSNYVLIEIVSSAMHRDFHLVRDLILGLLVPWVYIVSAIWFKPSPESSRGDTWRRIVLLNFVGAAMFASIVNSAGYWRIAVVSLPAFLVAVWIIETKLGVIVIRILTVIAVLAMVSDIRASQRNWYYSIETPSGRIALSVDDPLSQLQWFAARTHQGDYVFQALGSNLYFWLGLRNPTKVWWLTPCEFTRPEQVDDVLRDLELHAPRFILWNGDLDESLCGASSDHIQPVRDYLHAHYHKVQDLTPEFGPTTSAWELK